MNESASRVFETKAVLKTESNNTLVLGTFDSVLRDAEEGDVIRIFNTLRPINSDDGMPSFDGEYCYGAVLFATATRRILTRFYKDEMRWIEPIAGTTILIDDKHTTLIDQDGKAIPANRVGLVTLLKGALPDLPQEYFWSFWSFDKD